jgi:hypothetical protein
LSDAAGPEGAPRKSGGVLEVAQTVGLLQVGPMACSAGMGAKASLKLRVGALEKSF